MMSSATAVAAAKASSSTIRLLGPAWTRAFRNIWMLEELGIPYESVQDDSAMPWSRNVRNLVSTGKVPILLEYDSMDNNSTTGTSMVNDDDENELSSPPSFILTESSAINTYLADKYGNGNNGSLLVPSLRNGNSLRDRARYDQTVSCIISELDSQLWIHRKHDALGETFGKIPDAVEHANKQFDRINRHLSKQLHPYILGENFTAADILYIHCLDWSKSIGWHTNWPDNIHTYRSLCHARPAYQRAKALRDVGKDERKQQRETATTGTTTTSSSSSDSKL